MYFILLIFGLSINYIKEVYLLTPTKIKEVSLFTKNNKISFFVYKNLNLKNFN